MTVVTVKEFLSANTCGQLMVLVDDAGGEWPIIGHAPWNGCNLADFVMPFFLFIVGVAIALALKVDFLPLIECMLG